MDRGIPIPPGLAKFFPDGKSIFDRVQELEQQLEQPCEPPATLRVLGALLGWLKKEKMVSQADITQAIESWKGAKGLGKTVIADVFAAANRAVNKGTTRKE
jgi:hypothetical protein